MKELVLYVAQSLVDNKEAVTVLETVGPEATILELHVAPEDMGKVIGKQGRIAKAIRAVVRAATAYAHVEQHEIRLRFHERLCRPCDQEYETATPVLPDSPAWLPSTAFVDRAGSAKSRSPLLLFYYFITAANFSTIKTSIQRIKRLDAPVFSMYFLKPFFHLLHFGETPFKKHSCRFRHDLQRVSYVRPCRP